MSELRLAAVNGSPTEALDFNEIAESFEAIGGLVRSGEMAVERALVVALVEGRVTYSPIGHITLLEATGLLQLASRALERDKRGE